MMSTEMNLIRDLGEIRVQNDTTQVVNYVYDNSTGQWSFPFLGHIIQLGNLDNLTVHQRSSTENVVLFSRSYPSHLLADNCYRYKYGSNPHWFNRTETHYILLSMESLLNEWNINYYVPGAALADWFYQRDHQLLNVPPYSDRSGDPLSDDWWTQAPLGWSLLANIEQSIWFPYAFIEFGCDLALQAMLQNNGFLEALDNILDSKVYPDTPLIFLTDVLRSVPSEQDPDDTCYTTPRGHKIMFWPKIDMKTCFKAGYCMANLAYHGGWNNDLVWRNNLLYVTVPSHYVTAVSFMDTATGQNDSARDGWYYIFNSWLGHRLYTGDHYYRDAYRVDPALMGMLNAIQCGAIAAYYDNDRIYEGTRGAAAPLEIRLFPRDARGNELDTVFSECLNLPTIFLPEEGRCLDLATDPSDIDPGSCCWWFMTHSLASFSGDDGTYEQPSAWFDTIGSSWPYTWSGTYLKASTYEQTYYGTKTILDVLKGEATPAEIDPLGSKIFGHYLKEFGEAGTDGVVSYDDPRIDIAYDNWLEDLEKLNISFVKGSPYLFNRIMPKYGIPTDLSSLHYDYSNIRWIYEDAVCRAFNGSDEDFLQVFVDQLNESQP